MSKRFFSKRAEKNTGMNILNLVCVSMISLLLCACTSLNKNQVSPLANDTGLDDDQKMVCRKIPVSGSRIDRKVCGTKKQWALHEKKNGENSETYLRDAYEASRRDTSSPFPPEAPPEGMEAFVPH